MRKFILFIITVTLCHLGSSLAFADSLSVSLRVGDTRVQFTGFSSPSAFITIKQNNAVIGTTVADTNGNFDQTIDVYNPGVQSFNLSATDTLGHSTPTITYNINAIANTLITVSNIVIPPTIRLNTPNSTLAGYSNPAASLTVYISGGSTYPVTVSSDGSWSYTLLTSLSPGNYSAYALSVMPGSYTSLASQIATFTIASVATPLPSSSPVTSPLPSSPDSSATTQPSPSTNIVVTELRPSPSPLDESPELLNILNIFTPTLDLPLVKENLVGIVTRWITFWQLSEDPSSDQVSPQSGSCDLDNNGECDLVDLSILLYFIKP